MAGASGKRIAASNAKTIQQVRTGFAVSFAIYFISLLIFKSGRSWRRLFYFISTEAIAVVLWQQLEGMVKRVDDLSAAGLTSYIFDVIYVTWFVHVTTALISTKFWWLYLSIPSYALYRLVSFALPYIMPSSGSAAASRGSGPVPAGAATASSTEEPLSKRQQKIKEREKKGPFRLQQQR